MKVVLIYLHVLISYEKNKDRCTRHLHDRELLNFLLQSIKYWMTEKLTKCNLQSVAQLLNQRN